MGFFVALVLIWLACGLFAFTTAEDKGHCGVSWFFNGLVFGPIAVIACAGLGDRKLRRYIRLIGEKQGVDLPNDGQPISGNDVANDIIKDKRGY